MGPTLKADQRKKRITRDIRSLDVCDSTDCSDRVEKDDLSDLCIAFVTTSWGASESDETSFPMEAFTIATPSATVGRTVAAPQASAGRSNLRQVSAISSSRSSGFGPAAFATGAAVALAASASRRRSTGSVLRRTRNHQVSAVAMHGTPVCAGVVITGGAAGVGFAYADEFLARGHQVVICDVKDCSDAVESLKKKHGEKASIFSTVCDVSNIESINKLIDFVKDKIGVVHYWINNAGINGGRRRFTEISPETVEAVIRVNLGGILLCTHAAMRVMEQQAGVESHIFNTVGSGVKGGGTPGYVAYGATKRGLPQMTESLVKELEDRGMMPWRLPGR
ncbi:unnamed protein product [Cladocopium goreaui]|uniref:Chlorophyll(Ide) b reductase NOL, chloroplastic (Protein NON-YELLOW COLORING 1-LIKE) (OsNOL) (Protein NYC1-LIKE) (Short-chain dehydrogenase/reductase NOL) n=1 Tax=Cladocopium goreaui TaxID=2562237 RepID=A0A9P1CG12_9DINO|nr:unnamed protein product [Cladocopium goreaui]